MLGRLLLLLGRPIFRCCLSLREGKPPYTQERIPCCHVGFLSNNGSRKTCTLPHTLGEQEKPIQNRGPSISECLCRRQLFFPSEKVAKFERLIRVKERPPPIPDTSIRSFSSVMLMFRSGDYFPSARQKPVKWRKSVLFRSWCWCCEASRKQHLRKAEWKFLYSLLY